jgi:hypothetical protein
LHKLPSEVLAEDAEMLQMLAIAEAGGLNLGGGQDDGE